MPVTLADMKKIAPRGKPAILKSFVEGIPTVLAQHSISTPLRICHFIAQVAHESDEFQTTTEYASGKAYEGRKDLGNIYKGDGEKYKGRGLIQTTGRHNYGKFTTWLGMHGVLNPDFITNPAELAKFPWALLSAVYYWSAHDLNGYADTNNLTKITKIVNGGYRGWEARRKYFNRAWRQMGQRLEREAQEVNGR